MSVFWATVIGAAIGAAGAIAGGFGAAWWQTSRADDVAQKIRRAERREQGLVTLMAKLWTVNSRFNDLRLEARHGQSSAQYAQANELLTELKFAWYGTAGMVPDRLIVDAWGKLADTSQKYLPDGPKGSSRAKELSEGDREAGARFLTDLDRINDCLRAFRKVVFTEVSKLQDQGTP
jgi:hypothetical protein